MKNLKLIGLVVFSIAFNCHAQQTTYGISIFKSETDNGQKEYEAQKEVKLKSGYSFTGVAGTSDNQNMRAYIDEHKIYDAPNNSIISEAAFNSTNVDVSKAVGAVIGSGSVGASGGFSYTIPIKIPKGTKEIQPGIAVSYSSQSGSGIAGMGWHISGLSAITRSGNSLYHDGKPSPVTLTNQDHFNLNGQRLILMSGVHGTNGAQYKTESENYAKVRIENTQLGGPASFVVTQKNGLTYYYGMNHNYNVDSRNVAQNGVVISWHLKKVIDMQGNYMLFHYAADGGQFRIKKIEYTGNTLPNAKDDTIQTEILIIIGYSFTDYNAKVDKEIIKNMIKSNNLIYIYIQDPNPENIKSNLLKNLDFTVNFLNQIGIKFTLDSNCNNFYTPMELIQ